MIGLIIAIILIYVWWKHEPKDMKRVTGDELVKFGLSIGPKKFVGARVMGYAFRPRKNMVVGHVGVYNLNESARVALYDRSKPGGPPLIDTRVDDDHCMLLGSHEQNDIPLSCAPITKVTLKAGGTYSIVMSGKNQPVQFSSDFLLTNAEYVGKCWRSESSWGPPNISKPSEQIVVGPVVIYGEA